MTIYVDNSAVGTGSGESWDDAHLSLSSGLADWKSKADAVSPAFHMEEVWVDKDSLEDYLLFSAVIADDNIDEYGNLAPVYLVDKVTDEYVVSDKITPNFQVVNGTVTEAVMVLRGRCTYEGIFFRAGIFSFSGLFSVGSTKFKGCYFETSPIVSGVDNAFSLSYHETLEFSGCYLKLSLTNTSVMTDEFENLSVVGSVIEYEDDIPIISPSTISPRVIKAEFEDVEIINPNPISLVGFSGALATLSGYTHKISFIYCDLPTGFSLVNAADYNPVIVEALGCSSNGEAYINRRYTRQGTVETSTSINYLPGFVHEQSVRLSQEMTTTVLCSGAHALDSFKITRDIQTAQSTTFTVEILENFTVPLTNNTIWLELTYYGQVGSPMKTLSDVTRVIAANSFTNLPVGGGLGKWGGDTAGYRSVKLEVTVAIARIGLVTGVVRLSEYEAGKRVYVNPELRVE